MEQASSSKSSTAASGNSSPSNVAYIPKTEQTTEPEPVAVSNDPLGQSLELRRIHPEGIAAAARAGSAQGLLVIIAITITLGFVAIIWLEQISGRRSRSSGDLRYTKVHKGRCLDGYDVWKFALERISGRRSRPSGDLRCTTVYKGRCLDGYGVWKFALSLTGRSVDVVREGMQTALAAEVAVLASSVARTITSQCAAQV